MNKQIQNLKDKIWADEYWTKPNTDKLLPAQLNRFAELIVKECAELSVNSQYANTRSEYYEGFNEALVYVGNKIKKHFGVEE
jgi:alpha-L-fucosidase